MKRKSLKFTAVIALMSISSVIKSQWNPNWYPPSGFAAVGSDAYLANAVPWAVGGNQVSSPMNLQPNTNNFRIGTADGSPFELMANGTEIIHMDQLGRVGIGTNHLPSITNCVLDIKGSASNFRIFGDADGYVQSSTHLKLHYGSNTNGNPYIFEIKQGSPGSGTSRLNIDAFGIVKIFNKLDVGANVFPNTGARVAVDGQTSDGVVVIGSGGNNGAGNMALKVANNSGSPRVRVWVNAGGGEDTKMHIGGSTQIGFHMVGGNLLDNTTRLNVDASAGLNGIKVTTDNHLIRAINVEYNGTKTFVVNGIGKTQIGAGYPLSTGVAAAAMLSVDGMILAKDIRVAISTSTHWADFVFEKNYKLMPLNEVEKFISKNKHLPGVPSEVEVKKEGVDLTEMNIQLLQKVEELYLHTIQLQKQVDELRKK